MRKLTGIVSGLAPAILSAALVTSIGFAKPAPQAPYSPTDAERARWTMSDMRSLATALEAYAKDNHVYPTGTTIEALVAAVQPSYMRKAHATDAWGRAYVYVPAADGTSYRLVSAGSDGKTDPGSWESAGPLATFEADAVLDSGSMTRPWPFR